MSYWKRRSSRFVTSVLNTSIYFLVPCLLLPCSLLVAVINRIPSSKIRVGFNKFVATIFYIGKRVWYAKSYPVIYLRHWRYRNGLFPSVGTKLYSRDCNLQKACVNYAWSPRLHVESKWKTRSHVCPIQQISNVQSDICIISSNNSVYSVFGIVFYISYQKNIIAIDYMYMECVTKQGNVISCYHTIPH